MYKFLSEKMEFWKSDVNIEGSGIDLVIDGFKGLQCEILKPFKKEVPTEKLRQVRRLLGTIQDQPITIDFSNYLIHIQHILI